MAFEQIALMDVPTGSRVRKPSAIVFDYAYQREGIVIRELFDGASHVGIQWEGSPSVFEYSPDTLVEVLQKPEPADPH